MKSRRRIADKFVFSTLLGLISLPFLTMMLAKVVTNGFTHRYVMYPVIALAVLVIRIVQDNIEPLRELSTQFLLYNGYIILRFFRHIPAQLPSGPRRLPNLVASTTRSRRSAMARPTSCSLVRGP